jgi:CBS domain-containing protein
MQEIRRTLLVRDIMSSPIVTATQEESVKSVAIRMKKKGIGAIVVVDGSKKPIGIVTEGDIVRRLVTGLSSESVSVKVKEVMSKPLLVIYEGKRLEEAARAMSSKKIKKLGVVDDSKRLIGIVTASDIMRNGGYMIELMREIINTKYYVGDHEE